ncbi:MAG: ISLre2 family transposase [Clostridia bacterium]|nr:ISLre2 family transposase [Clostridia bacterium]
MENTKEKFRAIINEAVNNLFAKIAGELMSTSFTDIVRFTQLSVNELGARLIELIVGIVDDRYNEQRNKHNITLRHTKTRKMVSSMGELNLKRRLYYDKAACRYFFAVDELLNIEKFSRIEGELKTKLINDATLTSYGKASTLSGNCVSRQTVHNLVKRVPVASLQAQPSGEFRKVDKIFIEADEDHIHLNNGKSAEVKLVYVHEGWRKVCHGRTELINAKYFASIQNGDDIWYDVQDYIDEQYNQRNTELHLSGDGARWIRRGLDIFQNAEYHIDKFHIYKNITEATAGHPQIRRRIIENLKIGEQEKVHSLFFQLWNSINGPKQKLQHLRVSNSMSYIDDNFSAIDLKAVCGCSAEGHISHVLSDRLSSRPMGWSKPGAEKIAKLRTFHFNGGDFANLRPLRKENDDVSAKDHKNWPVREFNTDGSIHQGQFMGPSSVLEEIKKVLLGVTEE